MSAIWELDFYSRPILDENQKKLWEVVICESPDQVNRPFDSLFKFAKYCPSSTVNSLWLQTAINEALALAPQPPTKIRFFRRQMNNMITKACKDLDLQAIPSRRTYSLNQYLQERSQTVYPQEPGYDEKLNTSSFVQFQAAGSKPLPDALQGDKWAFVTLEASAFTEMPEWDIDFSEGFDLASLNLAPDALIPGIIIYSFRAKPLAAWMSGIELAYLRYNEKPSRLILETGADDSWILDSFTNAQTRQEAEKFEQAKQKAQNVHFLAVQTNPQSQSFAGFWLLQELALA